jgi:hypothetical protein
MGLGRGIPARVYAGDKKKKILTTELHRVLRRKKKSEK